MKILRYNFLCGKKDYENSKDEVASFVIAAKHGLPFLSNNNIEIPPVSRSGP